MPCSDFAQGPALPVTDRRPEAYRELADAGIMQPDGDDFRFTEDGWGDVRELTTLPRPIFAAWSLASRIAGWGHAKTVAGKPWRGKKAVRLGARIRR